MGLPASHLHELLGQTQSARISGRLSNEFRWIKESRFSALEMSFYSTASRATCLQTSASSLVLRIHPMQYPCMTQLEWLEQTATIIVQNTFFRADSKDSQYSFHRTFLRAAYHYIDLRNAIKHENGDHIIRLWKFWLLYFLGSGCKNYATKAANLICNLQADFPKAIAFVARHNRTVNVDGHPGHGKPIDQMIENYNL